MQTSKTSQSHLNQRYKVSTSVELIHQTLIPWDRKFELFAHPFLNLAVHRHGCVHYNFQTDLFTTHVLVHNGLSVVFTFSSVCDEEEK